MNKIAIIGAGGFGREVKSLIEDINSSKKPHKLYKIVGFYDDKFKKGTQIHSLPVLGTIEELNTVGKEMSIVLGIGDPKTKEVVLNKLSNPKLNYPTLIHPTVIMSNNNLRCGNLEQCILKQIKFLK